jgi:undecaprenyl-diphosphatase
MLEFLQNIDERILLFINGRHSLLFDNIMFWTSGKYNWWPFYLFLIIMIVYYKRKSTLLIIPAVILLVAISDQSSVHLFKEVFERLRPCHNPQLADQIHLVNNHCGGQYGFISSHASNSFAVAVFLVSVIKKRWFTVLLFAWAVLQSYSRVYLGVHYPFDIICGAIWGALLGYGVYRVYKSLETFRPGTQTET